MHDFVISLLKIADIKFDHKRQELGLTPLNLETGGQTFTKELDKLTNGVLDDDKDSFEAESNRRAVRYISILEDFDKKQLGADVLKEVVNYSRTIYTNLYELLYRVNSPSKSEDTNPNIAKETAIEKVKSQIKKLYKEMSSLLSVEVLKDSERAKDLVLDHIVENKLLDKNLPRILDLQFGFMAARFRNIIIAFKNIIRIAKEHDVRYNAKKLLNKFTDSLPELLKHRDYMYSLANKFKLAKTL
ncbi:MAG: hypothetical protein HOA17_02540 [Candidatus Melainabacteria bacterium]|nr:hypothetical protein [Candidatus Melainabacteria bacterium]